LPRNGSGTFSLPAGYTATTGQTITAAQHNDPLEDIAGDLNTARPVVAGGTGATTASGARTNLGAQAQADVLDDLATLGAATADGEFLVATGAGAFAYETGATARASLGLGTAAVLAEVTSAEYRSNTADRALSTDQVWGAMAEVALSDGANISLDLSTGFDFTVTLGGNRTLDNPTNAKVGQRGRIRVVQDGTGSRTLSFGTSYEFFGGAAPPLTTTAAAEDVLYYDVISATRVLVTVIKDIS